VLIEIHHYLHFDAVTITGPLAQLEARIMATLDELKAIMQENVIAANNADVALDAINTKIDELRAIIATGSALDQAQLDELAELANAAKTSLAGVATDIADAEQS